MKQLMLTHLEYVYDGIIDDDTTGICTMEYLMITQILNMCMME